jgi:L-lactate dehydrogenase complex protein LldG
MVAQPVMRDAREEILARIRRALADLPVEEGLGPAPPLPPPRPAGTVAERLQRFAERVRDYGADVAVVGEGDLRSAVAEAASRLGVRTLLVPPDWPPEADPPGLTVRRDHGLSPEEVAQVDAALTESALAVAETGSILLDGGPRQGRRLLTLLPDRHFCVVRSSRIVDGVGDAIRRLGPPQGPGALTWISGPSATSDIELSRVEGVHGPRHLSVWIVTDG